MIIAVLVVFAVCGVTWVSAQSTDLHPIVLVPALLGTRIEMKLNRTSVGHWWCPKEHDWFTVWANEKEYLPFAEVGLLKFFGII